MNLISKKWAAMLANEKIYGRTEATRFTQTPSTKRSLVGLRNNGNTCFMNAVIQCLLSTTDLFNYMLQPNCIDENVKTIDNHYNVILAFQELCVQFALGSSSAALDPINISNALAMDEKKSVRALACKKQEAADEFLSVLLEGFQACIVKTQVAQMFDLIQSTYSECEHCNFKENKHIITTTTLTQKFEHLNHNMALENLIMAPLIIQEGRVLSCQCQKGGTSFHKVKEVIQVWPKVLIVQLNRTDQEVKNESFIVYPHVLTFGELIVKGSINYRLYSVVIHAGKDVKSGHYMAFCKVQGEWFKFNDENVKAVSESSVIVDNATILFYEKEPKIGASVITVA